MDGDLNDEMQELAVESLTKHQKTFANELQELKESGATVFILAISKAKTLAKFLVEGWRSGLFTTGTQVLVVCHEKNQKVIDDVKQMLSDGEKLDDVLQGLMSVAYYPHHHLSTRAGQDFITRFRKLNSTLSADGRCSTAAANRTVAGYPLFKVKAKGQHSDVCTGIKSFAAFDQAGSNIAPEILLTYDAVIALGKALHYLTSTAKFAVSNSSANLNQML